MPDSRAVSLFVTEWVRRAGVQTAIGGYEIRSGLSLENVIPPMLDVGFAKARRSGNGGALWYGART